MSGDWLLWQEGPAKRKKIKSFKTQKITMELLIKCLLVERKSINGTCLATLKVPSTSSIVQRSASRSCQKLLKMVKPMATRASPMAMVSQCYSWVCKSGKMLYLACGAPMVHFKKYLPWSILPFFEWVSGPNLEKMSEGAKNAKRLAHAMFERLDSMPLEMGVLAFVPNFDIATLL